MPLLNIAGGQIATVSIFYKASEFLGSGRFSEVYKAFDSHSQTDVALKLYVGFDERALALARTEQDLLTRLAELNSEYFPKLRRAAKHRISNRNHPLLVLELGTYVGSDGRQSILSLAGALPAAGAPPSGRPVPDSNFWDADHLQQWIVHSVQAVRQLHAANIVHRDLKPSNILLKRSAGQTAAIPLFLDFNSATSGGEGTVRSGTPRYLPPEVTSGRRKEPDPIDDLWAIALVGWETLFGAGASPDSAAPPHHWVRGELPESLVAALKRALSLKPEDRFGSALDLLEALEAAKPPSGAASQLSEGRISSDDFATARSAMERIRWSMEEAIAPQGTIAVPKETADSVATLFSWLSEEQTQSLDLVSELHRLGPKAIPCSLEQSYKLAPESHSFNDVLAALRKLGEDDRSMAKRALELYALSSDTSVRAMCRGLCSALGLFPDVLLDSLTADEGILLPRERLALAELCIKHSDNDASILALSKYMCREYILNPQSYQDLRSRVARRMGEMTFADKALLIVQDTASKIWEELPEYEALTPPKRQEMDRGLLELMADAFASMGDDALAVLRAGRVPRQSDGDPPLKLLRRFAKKLGANHPAAQRWIDTQREKHPDDPDFTAAGPGTTQEQQTDLGGAFDEYLTNAGQREFNELRFSKGPAVFGLVRDVLRHKVGWDEVDRLLALLKGFQNRQRVQVVRCLLDNWNLFTSRDYATVVEILTIYGVPPEVRSQVIERLNSALGGKNDSHARLGLEKLLG